MKTPKPEDYNEFVMYHGFPCIGTNGTPHFDALGRPKKTTGTVTYRFLKQSFWEKM
tara:strand:- start:395 stop:562 length:168 start_codon:yes stop_codon:yes gene_type:complete